ncbi:MAG: hypothetical protein IKO95_07625 [Spirochaetia bacterium]|nr:hypothetical protein [Spirochaetia bacterium]
MKPILKQALILTTLLLFCTAAFVEGQTLKDTPKLITNNGLQIGEELVKQEISEGLPIFENHVITEITDYYYDDQNRIIRKQFETGAEKVFDGIKVMTLCFSGSEKYSYDHSGNIVSYENSFSKFNAQLKYDEYGEVVHSLINYIGYYGDPIQLECTVEYDEKRNITSLTETMTVNEFGQLITNKTKELFAYKYNEKGNAIYIASSDGKTFSNNNMPIQMKYWKPNPYLHRENTPYYYGQGYSYVIIKNDNDNFISYINGEQNKVVSDYLGNIKQVNNCIYKDGFRFKTEKEWEYAPYSIYEHELDVKGRVIREIEYKVTRK